VHAVRGEPVSATLGELVRSAEQVSDPQMLWTTVEGAAFASFGTGQLREAGELWRTGARRFTLKAHEWLYRAAETAVRLRDGDAASADLAAFDKLGLHGPLIEHRRALIQAGLVALASRPSEAARLYEGARRGFRSIGAPLDEALAAMDMAELLDPAEIDIGAVAEARAALVRLKAVPLVAVLDAALATRTGSVAPAQLPAGERVEAV
jgi:hypothetical protein